MQSHSLEDGEFESDHIRIGRNATIGPMSFIHYGVEMGAGSVLDADSFLKGEMTPERSMWRGNLARITRGPAEPAEPSPTTAMVDDPIVDELVNTEPMVVEPRELVPSADRVDLTEGVGMARPASEAGFPARAAAATFVAMTTLFLMRRRRSSTGGLDG